MPASNCGIRPADRRVRRIAGAQEGERRLVAEGRAGVAEELVGAAHRERFFERRFFEPPDVGQAAHRERGAERRTGRFLLVVACCHVVSLMASCRLRSNGSFTGS
jgi:hypothetical protein